MITLKAPKATTSVSYQGIEYPVEDGAVALPEAAIVELRAHGLRPVSEPTAAATKRRPSPGVLS